MTLYQLAKNDDVSLLRYLEYCNKHDLNRTPKLFEEIVDIRYFSKIGSGVEKDVFRINKTTVLKLSKNSIYPDFSDPVLSNTDRVYAINNDAKSVFGGPYSTLPNSTASFFVDAIGTTFNYSFEEFMLPLSKIEKEYIKELFDELLYLVYCEIDKIYGLFIKEEDMTIKISTYNKIFLRLKGFVKNSSFNQKILNADNDIKSQFNLDHNWVNMFINAVIDMYLISACEDMHLGNIGISLTDRKFYLLDW